MSKKSMWAEDRLKAEQSARYKLEDQVAELKGLLEEKTEYAECLEELLDHDFTAAVSHDIRLCRLRQRALSLAAQHSPIDASGPYVYGKAEVFYEFLTSTKTTNFLQGDAAAESPPSSACAPLEVDSPSLLTKATSHLDAWRPCVKGGDKIMFYQSSEEPGDVSRMEVALNLDFLVELGLPKDITVTIEPGDTLNAPDAKVIQFPGRSGEV